MSTTFEDWLATCERITGEIAGVDLDSLGDGPSYESWREGCPPRDYVMERLEDAGFPMEVLE